MKVTVTEQSASERTLEVVVDAKQVETAFQKAFKKNLKQFALPGFRKGKVPTAMAQRYITDGALVRDVVNDLVPRAFDEAIKEQNLEPISQPDWDLIQNERGKDLVFKASFIVAPILPIDGYDGTSVRQEREEITEEHIQDTLERMRAQHAEFVPLEEERGLQEGDFATVDYSSYQDGEEIENGSVTNYMMEMKPENYIEGFVSNLVGAKPGDERTFDISFPADYKNSDLAGETVTFKFNIHDIKVKRLPELDDEFAKSHSDQDTLDELKKAIREHLEEGVNNHAEGQAVTSIVKDLLEQVPEDVIPPQLRQHHAQRAIRNRMYEMSQRGISLEQLLAARGQSQDDWLKEMMGAGLFEARLEVLYKSLAQAENVSVSDSEMDDVIKVEAGNHKLKPKQLRRQMEKNGTIELLEHNLLTEKLHKMLLEKADINYVAPGTPEEKPEKAAKAEKRSKAETLDSKEESKESEKAAEAKTESKSKKATGKSKAKPSKKAEPKKDEPKAKSKAAKSKSKPEAKKSKKASKKKSK